jgi:hypothetical protein
MIHPRRPYSLSIVIALLLGCLTACSSGAYPQGVPSNADGGSSVPTKPDQKDPDERGSSTVKPPVEIEVLRAKRISSSPTDPDEPPTSAKELLTIDVTVRNNSAPRAVAVAWSKFSLVTDRAIVLDPRSPTDVDYRRLTGIDSSDEESCHTQIKLAASGKRTCQLVFELESGEATEISFEDGPGSSASTPIHEAAYSATDCRLTSSGSEGSSSCVSCLELNCENEVSALLDCMNAERSCTAPCASSKADLKSCMVDRCAPDGSCAPTSVDANVRFVNLN